jgi:hypothetical protein
MSSAPPTPTDNLTYAIHSANETIYGQHPGITGTLPLTPTHTLYNLQPRQYAPNIMYTSTPNIGFHSDPPPAQSHTSSFSCFFTHKILRLYMHIHYKLCIPFIFTAQSCPKTYVVNYHTQVTKTDDSTFSIRHVLFHF